MTVIHANDPTTKFLSTLYNTRDDISMLLNESSTNSDVQKAICQDNSVMMLGHGNQYGLFSRPNKKGKYDRFMITDRHVQFLRDKTCIGIWCFANLFAEKYGLTGLFSGMIVSEIDEATELHISTTKEEIDNEMDKFVYRMRYCIEHYGLEEVPMRMKDLDNRHSCLTTFNYSNLFFLK